MKPGRVLSIAKKEVFHILRDPFTLALALLLPVLMVTLFGFAIELNVRNIRIAVFDGDRSTSSRLLTEAIGSSGYFLVQPVTSPAEAVRRMDGDRSRAALIIEAGFEKHLGSGEGGVAQLLLDGSDSSTIGSVIGYMGQLQTSVVPRLTGTSLAPPVELTTRYLYNGELNSRWFTVPGLLVVVLGILSILLTALTVAREWESGSMELLLSTPVTPLEIILGKLLPYLGLGLVAVIIVYVVARGFMGVPFRGSHFVFLTGCFLFLVPALAQGLLISVLTRRQQLAMQFAMMSGLLPSILLSGFIFPIESMPVFFQWFTSILPARWFASVSRDVFLKGAGFADLTTPFLALLAISAVMVTVATKRFKKDVEP